MDPTLRGILDRIYAYGQQNDSATTVRWQRMLNITPETGELLRMLVIAGRHSRVLELGTSNGYSTIWLADAVREHDGRVVTIEHQAYKRTMAVQNFREAGVDQFVDSRFGDIGQALPSLIDFDLVFLDSERTDYVAWWPHLQASVRRGGLLVVDNATSHPEEMAPFADAVSETAGFSSVLLPIGNGELVIMREP
ncbi:MAG: DUF1442 domain-containing protein [Chloroflexi bacterium]|nr:DUF1442 domain-containing protein [Chloroflexota bacterium]